MPLALTRALCSGRARVCHRRSSDRASGRCSAPPSRAPRARCAAATVITGEREPWRVCGSRTVRRERGLRSPEVRATQQARESGETRETVRRESACFLVVKYSNTCPPTGWRAAGRQRRALHLQRGAQARAAGGAHSPRSCPARAWGKRSRRPGHSGWRGFLVRRLTAGSLRRCA